MSIFAKKAIGANTREIARAVKKEMKRNPAAAVSITEYAPAILSKRGNYTTWVIQDIIEDQFERAGRGKHLTLNRVDIYNAGLKYNGTLKDFVAKKLQIPSLTAEVDKVNHFLRKPQCSQVPLTKDVIPYLEEQIKQSSGSIKKAFMQLLEQAKKM